MSGIKRPPVMVDRVADAVIDSVSKAALVDLVADMLRASEGDEELNGEALARVFVERFEPVARVRNDRVPSVNATLARLRKAAERWERTKARAAEATPHTVCVDGRRG